LPPEELVLGAVLAQYQEVFARAAIEGGEDLPARDELIRRGIDAALDEHISELRRAAEAASGLTQLFDEKFRGQAEFQEDVREE
jgi:hypothetical protein